MLNVITLRNKASHLSGYKFESYEVSRMIGIIENL